MIAMQRLAVGLLSLVLCSPAWAQIVAPVEVAPFKPIAVSLADDVQPTDPTVKQESKVEWSISSGMDAIHTSPRSFHAWAAPGRYDIEAAVVTQLYRDMTVFVPDAANPTDLTKAKVQTIRVPVGDGIGLTLKKYRATITVGTPAPPGPGPGPGPAPTPAPSNKPTAAVYVYEKDDGSPPPAVLAGLNRLNRELKIVATAIEDDTTDGDNDVPQQYKVPFAAAKAAGLPRLVIMAESTVLRTVSNPKTEADVWGAAQ